MQGVGQSSRAANDSANGNWTYSYDAFNRLVGSNKNSGQSVFSYVYDRFGNRWQQNGPNSFIATFTGNNPGNPQNNNRMDGYSYDAAGNLLNDGSHSYTYDAENRLIQVDNGSTATYVYDAESHRVQKTSAVGNLGDPAGSWIYFYDQAGRWVQKFNSPGNTFVQGNIFAGGRHLASETQGSTDFSHSDWLGSARLTSSPSRAYISSVAYAPFGETYASYGTSDPSFTGQNPDTVSTDYDFLYRPYSIQGRWPSPDPSGVASVDPSNPQSWNRYAYVLNNPLREIDPLGLDCIYFDDEVDGQAWVIAGDCLSQTDNGYYVDGSIIGVTYNQEMDFASLGITVDQENNWMAYSYKPYDSPFPSVVGGQCTDLSNCPPIDSVLVPGSSGGAIPTTTIGPSDHNANQDVCRHQSDLAGLEELLPGITRGEYVSTATKIGEETGAHLALEGAAASGAFKRLIRAKTGIPMTKTAKLLGRATTFLLLYSGYKALKTAQDEYKACMDYLNR